MKKNELPEYPGLDEHCGNEVDHLARLPKEMQIGGEGVITWCRHEKISSSSGIAAGLELCQSDRR
jgi:hypothetical protein